MYKIIDLGFDVKETGERRVSLLDGVLTKTASSEIQRFWDGLVRKEDSAYIWVIGVSAMEYYGCNNNGDAFTESDLKKYHTTFVENAHVFLHHVNKDPKRSIGKPVFSFYNDVMHRVELIMELSKSNMLAADTIAKIKSGEDIYVSMGCNVAFDVCSICGNKAKTRAMYCDHLRYNLKKILPDGRQVYALNPNPKFFDISIVRKPADPTAFTLDKAASAGYTSNSDPVISSAELGEQAMKQSEKLAALQKLSDIIKEVDGCITDVKDGSGDTNVLREIARRGFKDVAYPDIDIDSLQEHHVSPLGYARAMLREGAPLTFGDALFMSGRHCFGDSLRSHHLGGIMSLLPGAVRLLQHSPLGLPDIISDLFRTAHADAPQEIVIKIIRPVAQSRVFMLSKMASEAEIEKIASTIPGVTGGHQDMPIHSINKYELLSDNVPGNLRTTSIVGMDGKTYTTSFGELRNTSLVQETGLLGKKALGAALLTVALGALFSDPDKVKNIAAAILSGAAGAALLTSDYKRLSTGQVSNAASTAAFHKQAAAVQQAQVVAQKLPKMVYAGMAIPAALSLDYLYNKLKYKGEDPEWHLTGASKALHNAGKFVTQNPVTSVGAGGVTGAAIRHLMLKKGWI